MALEELVLEFDPVQSERVQGTLKQVHAHDNAEDDTAPNTETEHHLNRLS